MFKSILSRHWDSLHPILQKHYDIKDNESMTLYGRLTVKHGNAIKILMPLIRISKALVPVEGDDFEVIVVNKRLGESYCWDRQFKKDGNVYPFQSKMQRMDNDIIEFVGLGIGIRMGLEVSNGSLHYVDKGYVIKIGSMILPIPIHLLVGRSEISETVNDTDEHDFTMQFVMKHPWFGFMFSYEGFFDVASEPDKGVQCDNTSPSDRENISPTLQN